MSSVFSKRTCWVVKRSGFAYLPCWHWGNMQILVFWSENKPLLMKWDGNIQNVLFCCGRTCLRTSLDNTRHASTLDSQSFYKSRGFFQPVLSRKITVRVPRVWFQSVLSFSAVYICGKRKEHKCCFVFFITSLFPQDVPFSQNKPRLHVFTCFSSSPLYRLSLSRGVALFMSGCRPKTFLRENTQCVMYSRTLGLPLYGSFIAVLLLFGCAFLQN